MEISIIFRIYIIILLMTEAHLSGAGLQFVIDYPRQDEEGLVEGRALLLLSQNAEKEPRFQITDNSTTGFVFGLDAIDKEETEKIIINNKIFGYPVSSLDDIPSGEYWVQAMIHKYETFNLKTGHRVKLPMDRGEGQQWHSAPGYYYSTPK